MKNFCTIKYFLTIICCTFLFQSCSGPNPNPGERTADIFWYQNNYKKALEIIEPNAQKGFPWAQLRIGVAYQLGAGVPKDFDQALLWYKKAAVQKAEGGWAEGKTVGSFGKSGYFNQNGDAMVAQYQIATIYLSSDKNHENLTKAYLWINYVLKESKGQPVFYCCEFAGGRWITSDMILDVKSKTEAKMTAKEKKIAEDIFGDWSPIKD